MDNATASEVAGMAVGALLLCAAVAAPKVDSFISSFQRRYAMPSPGPLPAQLPVRRLPPWSAVFNAFLPLPRPATGRFSPRPCTAWSFWVGTDDFRLLLHVELLRRRCICRSLGMCRRCGDLRVVACSGCGGVGRVIDGGPFGLSMLGDLLPQNSASGIEAGKPCIRCQAKGRIRCPDCSKLP
ncbi:hypothetical protein Taro_047201 [Colocasia esculenta]|uniref:Uncharacterized protein n=1 Tax=Colocasia esculenta TaxID=4460 RepID=A0A843X556_COLES|nr:hypothetical protein [Colocasia esculenta]